MKICISELTFNSFEGVFNEALANEDILLVNREGKLSKGEGLPEVVFISYEIMLVPNIVNITYGRGVGYVFEEESFEESIEEISATQIRMQMREKGELE